MKKYIQLFISIALLILSKLSFSMEERNNDQVSAILQLPDELLLKIIGDALDFTKSRNIFEALDSLKMHKLNIICQKFRALMQDDTITKKQTLSKLLQFYKNLLRELFVIEVNNKLQLKNIQFHKRNDKESKDLEEKCHSTIIEFLSDNNSKLQKTNRPIIAQLLLLIDNEALAINCIKLLIFYGADINADEENRMAPLHICAIRGWLKATELLLNHPNIIIDNTCHHGSTALIDMCLSTPQLAIVKLLLAKGANPNLKPDISYNSCTPLIYTIKNENLSIAELLLSHPNIDINIPDEHKRSALMWGAYLGNLEIVKLLLEKNANTKLVDNFGKTAYNLATKYCYAYNRATKNRYDNIAQLIEEHEKSNL